MQKITKHYLNYNLHLLAGAVLIFFSNGNPTSSLIPWIAPAPILYLLQKYKSIKSLLLITITLIITSVSSLWTVTSPLGFGALPLLLIGSGILILPYVTTFFCVNKVSPKVTTLLFPAAVLALELLYTPHLSTSFSWSKTQTGNITLIQISALLGHYSISFMLAWFPAIAATILTRKYRIKELLFTLIPFLILFCSAYIYGHQRCHNKTVTNNTVKAATVVNSIDGLKRLQNFRDHSRDDLQRSYTQQVQCLFQRSEEVVTRGARLLLWQEHALLVDEHNWDTLINNLCEFSRKHSIDLIIGITTVSYRDRVLLKNELLWCDQRGSIVCRSNKKHPLPMEPSQSEGWEIKHIEKSYGILSPVLCADADYPEFIRQCGEAGTDLLLVPSLDWKEISKYHMSMLPFRAVENGMTLLRAGGSGISAVISPKGQTVEKNHIVDATPFEVMVTLESCQTPYSYWGRIPISLLLSSFFY